MPADETGQYVVWRTGRALLAVPVTDVVEVTALEDRALRPSGSDVALATIPGLQTGKDAPVAVILRGAERSIAVLADAVEGVLAAERAAVRSPPEWLAGVARPIVKGLVRLVDERIAVVIDPDALVVE